MSREILVRIAQTNVVLLFASAIWLAWLAESLFRTVRDGASSEVLDDLGSPASLRDALSDPGQRWRRFMRERRYETTCPESIVLRVRTIRRLIHAIFLYWAISGIVLALGWLITAR
jgi:hypothetical protein